MNFPQGSEGRNRQRVDETVLPVVFSDRAAAGLETSIVLPLLRPAALFQHWFFFVEGLATQSFGLVFCVSCYL